MKLCRSKMIVPLLCFTLFLSPIICHKRAASLFHNPSHNGEVDGRVIDEASGLAASREFSGVLYTHNDHGDGPKIYAIDSKDGTLTATFTIGDGANNTDWEDIAVGPCSATAGSGSCIYICDAGYSSRNDHPANVIYKVKEPKQLLDQTLNVSATLRFNWTAEESQTIMVDPNANVYIISNVYHGRGMVVKLPSDAWNQPQPTWVNSSYFVNLSTHHHDPTGGDISPDGQEIILQGIHHVYYWQVSNGNILEALTQPSQEVPYRHFSDEGAAEAICWSHNGDGYYTLSEGGLGAGENAALFYYARSSSGPSGVVG